MLTNIGRLGKYQCCNPHPPGTALLMAPHQSECRLIGYEALNTSLSRHNRRYRKMRGIVRLNIANFHNPNDANTCHHHRPNPVLRKIRSSSDLRRKSSLGHTLLMSDKFGYNAQHRPFERN